MPPKCFRKFIGFFSSFISDRNFGQKLKNEIGSYVRSEKKGRCKTPFWTTEADDQNETSVFFFSFKKKTPDPIRIFSKPFQWVKTADHFETCFSVGFFGGRGFFWFYFIFSKKLKKLRCFILVITLCMKIPYVFS